ncbi:MAG TPA: DUF488 domain-containing protein [Edaphocola sp.]|nr:DUF488 domain-containing protein [Edaphocola sp.]
MKTITIKRVYDSAATADGYRILVDRLWPRGISKEHAAVEEWLKDLGPSTELRKWFNHEPEKFPEFKKRYEVELEEKRELLHHILTIAQKEKVCLVYSAKDEVHNQAVVLQAVLQNLNDKI